MNNKLSTTFVLFLLCFSISITVAAERKNLKLILDKWDKVKDTEDIFKSNLTFVKEGDKDVKINGQLEQLVDINDEYRLNITIFYSRQKDGQYAKYFLKENLGLCNVEGTFSDDLYKALTSYVNIHDGHKCPLKKRTYVIKDYHLDSSKFQRLLRHGFYKSKISFIHKDKEVLQYKAEFHTVEE